MTKDAFTLRLHAYADGELDAAEAGAVETHLAGCAGCRAELEQIRALKSALRTLDFSEVAPEGLSAEIQRRVAASRLRQTLSLMAGGGGLLAACLAGALVLLQPASPVYDAVRGHQRAVSGAVALAVASNDRRQVKPWLAGQLGFAPPVLEKAAGCTLVGARTERLGHKPASALAYSCDGHAVDFYAIADRSPDAPLTVPRVIKARSAHVVTWQRGRLTCYAVSDAPEPKLLALAGYIQSHAAEG